MHEIGPRTMRFAGLCLLVFLALAGLGPQAGAETFIVTRTDDDNGPCTPDDCALREAVIAANAAPGADRIELPAGVYTLSLTQADDENAAMLGDLDVLDDLEIAGDPAGLTIIRTISDDRVFEMGHSTVTISHLEITGGRQVRDSGASVFGGCVRTIGGAVTFVNTTIANCYCIYEGGGVAVEGSAATFLNSTISGGVSETWGGGIYHIGLARDHDLNLINSTLSGNWARFRGGGLFKGNDGETLISHSTIAKNEAPSGDAVFNDFPTRHTVIQNSLVEGKCRGISMFTRGGNVGGPDVVDHCFKFSILSTDHAASDLGLLPLGNYGGPTRTHGLRPGSPALDIADPAYCEPTDQRGVARPVGAACDAGAVEGIVDALDVPTLDGWGVAVLVLMVGGAAVVALRRMS